MEDSQMKKEKVTEASDLAFPLPGRQQFFTKSGISWKLPIAACASQKILLLQKLLYV
ncbi:MAG: hypothetical protein ACPLRX_09710 [Candidatus Saccharicenans sp.]